MSNLMERLGAILIFGGLAIFAYFYGNQSIFYTDISTSAMGLIFFVLGVMFVRYWR